MNEIQMFIIILKKTQLSFFYEFSIFFIKYNITSIGTTIKYITMTVQNTVGTENIIIILTYHVACGFHYYILIQQQRYKKKKKDGGPVAVYTFRCPIRLNRVKTR